MPLKTHRACDNKDYMCIVAAAQWWLVEDSSFLSIHVIFIQPHKTTKLFFLLELALLTPPSGRPLYAFDHA